MEILAQLVPVLYRARVPAQQVDHTGLDDRERPGVVVTESGSPFRPSQTTMPEVPWTPRFLISVSTTTRTSHPHRRRAHRPRMSRSPLQVTPIATITGRLVTCPSRT